MITILLFSIIVSRYFIHPTISHRFIQYSIMQTKQVAKEFLLFSPFFLHSGDDWERKKLKFIVYAYIRFKDLDILTCFLHLRWGIVIQHTYTLILPFFPSSSNSHNILQSFSWSFLAIYYISPLFFPIIPTHKSPSQT